MAKEKYYPPDYLIFLSDKRQSEGESESYLFLEPPPTPPTRLMRELTRAINRLPARQKQTIKLFLKNHSFAEIAAKMKVTESASRKLYQSAIENLKKRLTK